MANTRQTQADPQQQSAYAICGCCGGEIYLGQLYYEMDDRYVCPECLGEYAKSSFLSRQRTAMLPQWRAGRCGSFRRSMNTARSFCASGFPSCAGGKK